MRGDDYRRALGAEHLRRVEIMQTRKFFRDLGPFKLWRPESFMQLADKATRRHIPAHAVVARRGASCDTVAFVVQGELKLEGAVAVGTQRKSVDLLRLGPGSMLGDVEIAEGPTNFLATATTTRRGCRRSGLPVRGRILCCFLRHRSHCAHCPGARRVSLLPAPPPAFAADGPLHERRVGRPAPSS